MTENKQISNKINMTKITYNFYEKSHVFACVGEGQEKEQSLLLAKKKSYIPNCSFIIWFF